MGVFRMTSFAGSAVASVKIQHALSLALIARYCTQLHAIFGFSA
jgi:hypothetical protein